jgi:hypothetical protein
MSDHDQDLTMIAADDQLLDLLGAGQAPDDGDRVSAMLAAWREDLDTEPPTLRRAAPPIALPRKASRPRGLSRAKRLVLAAAAAVAVLAGAASVLARDAGPDSPLWPLTRLLYEQRASSAVAEQQAQQHIDDARQAIDNGQYSDAQALLDEASRLAEQVQDQSVADHLREEIDALRGLLAGVLPPPAPTAPAPGATPGPTTAPDGGGVVPSLPLPSLPLPSLPLPTPTCVLVLPPLGGLPTCVRLP